MKNSKMSTETKFTAPHILSGMPADTPVLLALSGGADSSALLYMLCEYCKKSGAPLAVAHVNHMIRGEDAERDRDFCRSLAKKLGLPFYLLEADVPALAKEHKRGLEEEARITRYEFFEKVMRENSIPLLATAHNATDNAETVIFNLTRGSGLHGMCGIPPVREFSGGRIIRPLLKMSKDEILAFCRENGIKYVTDDTNSDVAYSRNRIRNRVLPELLSINENAIANITRACELARLDDEFMIKCAESFISSLEDRHVLPLSELCSLDKALLSRIAAEVLGDFFEVSAAHITSFILLVEKGMPHSEAIFPRGTRAVIENGAAIITQEKRHTPTDYCYRLIESETQIPELDGVIFITDTENSDKIHESLKNIYKKSIKASISSDTINNGLFVRPKKDGDKILCGGMHKKLKKLFCEKKLSPKARAVLPVFCDEKGVVWVPGVALRDGEKNSDVKKTVIFCYGK